jgi:hypothetical protein
VVFFNMIWELLWQRCIFLHDFGTARTVWYFSTWFRNCFDSVVFFYMISELLWQCGIFLHDIGTVLTVWYFSTWYRNCSDSVVYFYMISELLAQCGIYYMIYELFWQCDICLHNFWTVLTVWYFSTWFRNFSDSIVFFYMISELLWQCDICFSF